MTTDNARMPASPIYLISGVPGAGKTTVARALCARFPQAVHVPGDDLRDLVVSGFASALDPWTDEHSRQFSLSWRAGASIARRYADAGFTAVIDDVVRGEDLRRDFYPELRDRPLRKVLLKPTLEMALARSRQRTTKTFDPQRLEAVIARLYETLANDAPGWLVVDTSQLTIEQTVDAIVHAAW